MSRLILASLLCFLATSVLAQPAFVGDGPVTGPTRTTPFTAPASIANGGTYTSTCLVSTQARAFDVFAALTGAATLQVQRYVDQKCTYPAGTAVPTSPQALATGSGCPLSDYCGDVASNDGMPFQGVIITVVNTSGATNTVTTILPNQAAE